eukprot:UN28402
MKKLMVYSMSDIKIIQTSRKFTYFAFIRPYKDKVSEFSSSLDDFNVQHMPLFFPYSV